MLYELHGARMKSLAFHLLRSHADAEDAVQEAFMKVYKSMNGFDGQSALATWIYRILINCCYDALRRRTKLAETQSSNEGRARPATESKLPMKIALDRALARLNERQRLVFVMFEVEGLKHSEIAGILEAPEGTCRSWLFEAKRELKRMLMEGSA
jgi:RNA polymerase sigma-70 factor (ECF subfamily)